MVAGLETKLSGLKDDLSRLETTQLGLMAGVKDCCKNESALALLVKAAVQEHMAAVRLFHRICRKRVTKVLRSNNLIFN